MATHPKPFAQAVAAAQEGAIVVDRSDLGMLRFTGATRLDLIHRMSTQAVKELPSGTGAATILTTDIGRMIDRLILYAASDAVYALTGENNADDVARYLLRYVFFQDDFHLEDLSAQTFVLGVYGAGAEELLRPLFGDAVDVPLHHWRRQQLAGATVYLHRTDAVARGGYFVIGDSPAQEAIWDLLAGAGITPAGEDAFDYLRIASGLPRFGREITNEYIPLETGLWADVSFNKGCYTGQEVIARMESRGRLARKLVRLQAGGPVMPGAAIEAGGRNVGEITSAAEGPGGVLALGYLKTRALGDGSDEGAAGETFSTEGVPLRLLEE